MPFIEPKVRGGLRRARPVPPVTAGVRKRGRSGKLTPFIAIQEGTVRGWFGGTPETDAIPMVLLVGSGADVGKIAIHRVPEAQANISLRRPTKGSTEFVIESVMIPFIGGPIPRKEADFESTQSGMIIVLPWIVPRDDGEL